MTNGVTPRRFLAVANPGLSGLITDTIGEGWLHDLDRLRELEPHADDNGFLDAFAAVKTREQGTPGGAAGSAATASCSNPTRCST